MDLNTFVRLYQEFLNESKQKGWIIETITEEFGNYRSSIKSVDGIEVQFFLKLDLENYVKLSDKRNQSRMNYGVIRKQGKGDVFAKEVLDAFHKFWATRASKRRHFFLYRR